jgi:hypothetical protein
MQLVQSAPDNGFPIAVLGVVDDTARVSSTVLTLFKHVIHFEVLILSPWPLRCADIAL